MAALDLLGFRMEAAGQTVALDDAGTLLGRCGGRADSCARMYSCGQKPAAACEEVMEARRTAKCALVPEEEGARPDRITAGIGVDARNWQVNATERR